MKRKAKALDSAQGLCPGGTNSHATTPVPELMSGIFNSRTSSPSRLVGPSASDTVGLLEPLTTPTDKVVYSDRASILLVGFPRAGKHTLSVIASVVLRRQYVDFGRAFEKGMGMTPYDYISTHGMPAYREAETKVTKSLLNTYSEDHVIGGLTAYSSNAQKRLLRAFAQTHPVIYVQRDKADLGDMFGCQNNQEQLYRIHDASYRSYSTFDFYNITWTLDSPNGSNPAGTLKLKQTEVDFVRFLHRIFGRTPKLLRSVEALSASYTYVLQVPLHWLDAHVLEYDKLECGADMVSLVIDPGDKAADHFLELVPRAVATLRRHARAPIMIDVSYPDTQDSANYLKLLRLCLRSSPDFLTVCLRLARDQVKSLASLRGSTQIVGTYHYESSKQARAADELPWTKIHDLAMQLACHAIRITHQAASASENLQRLYDAQVARETWTMPLVAYNTGALGRTSVCFNPVLSPVVLPSMTTDGITIDQAQTALYSSFIHSRKKFTILGQSVSYSLSPAMHNAAYAACGMPHSYGLLQSDDLSSIQELLADPECGGLAISLPFKMQVLPMLHHINPEARDIGAVNTVVIERQQNQSDDTDTILKGYNTDHVGIRECIGRKISPANFVRDSSTALVIGAGGMARAAIYACRTLGIRTICLYNRTASHAEALADHYRQQNLHVHVLSTLESQWPERLRQPTVIVSCIPAHSISGQAAHELTIPAEWLQSRTGGVFVELAYKPLVTRLMNQMQSRSTGGWVVVDGLDVLVEQGISQFELLTGRPAPVHVMRRAIRQQYELVGPALQ
ncbi:shikimate-5-dehydrogenase [Cyphellophora europaea CBS 101466]|uniref:Shikimate-5-dehydrogenase n=1 Tax=Cyphellophora europaea (strain CBS 101466) TaxID=1220924 RepID=W2RRN6_CYPE1|nr:shikimate-5-dehydrogenase [Cyphellophora europaea CBS 101466]ETN38975.1 shikimate-5-dehydrogenase [Cyphellophora europaea CBS 101466]